MDRDRKREQTERQRVRSREGDDGQQQRTHKTLADVMKSLLMCSPFGFSSPSDCYMLILTGEMKPNLMLNLFKHGTK